MVFLLSVAASAPLMTSFFLFLHLLALVSVLLPVFVFVLVFVISLLLLPSIPGMIPFMPLVLPLALRMVSLISLVSLPPGRRRGRIIGIGVRIIIRRVFFGLFFVPPVLLGLIPLVVPPVPVFPVLVDGLDRVLAVSLIVESPHSLLILRIKVFANLLDDREERVTTVRVVLVLLIHLV